MVFNDYIGPLPHIDWGARLLAVMAKVRVHENESQAEHRISRQPHPEPSLPLEDYAGTYSDPLYGQATVAGGKCGRAIFPARGGLSAANDPASQGGGWSG